MWIKVEALLCCIIATSLAANEPRSKKKDDPRGKRNLEYSISHHFTVPNFRAERRISTGPQLTQIPQFTQISHYPVFFPAEKPYIPYRRGRPNLPAPPYAVQMEPLVHYSQRDPLYDANGLTFIGDGTNEIKPKDDLLKEPSHISPTVYAHHEPVKHIVERPVYIKEPEPIIEIIIKESNITLPPLPVPVVTPAPRKKEQVQVFYVKYKKNPNAHGKESIVYDKPIPALSPHIPDEPVQVEPPVIKYEAPVTYAPPPSTTLRAILKPDSEVFHADKGIHITFGKTENEQYKRSNDGAKEESAPEPAVSNVQDRPLSPQPQGRQFNPTPDRQFNSSPDRQFNSSPERQFPPQSQFFQKRPPVAPTQNFQNFKSEPQRFPPFRPFNNQPPPQFKQQPQFGRQFPQPSLQSHQQLPTTRPPVSFQNQPFPPRGSPPSFQQLPGNQHVQFNQPFAARQPVPYQPFDQVRNQQPQIQFPRTHTHFPIHQQQLPQIQNQQPFNAPFSEQQKHLQATQQQFQNNLRNEELLRQHQQYRQQQAFQEQLRLLNSQQQFPQQFSQPFVQQQQHNFGVQQQNSFSQQKPNNFGQQQPSPQFPINNAQPERIIPPGGELIHSVPKFEQHISVPANPAQAQPQQQIQAQSQEQPQTQLQGQPQRQSQGQPQGQSQGQPQGQSPARPQALALSQTQAQQLHQQLQSNPQLQLQTGASLSSQEFTRQIQAQFKQPVQLQFSNSEQPNFASNLQQPHQQQNIIIQQQHSTPTNQATSKPIIQFSSSTQPTPSSTTQTSKTSSEVPQRLTEKDLKDLNIELPDEVPDDLREQLLSSGILKNAQISVLDYDKVGDIPLSALPPDQLANFYGAGGGQQIAAGSEQRPVVVGKDGSPVEEDSAVDDMEMEGAESEVSEVKAVAPVEMKVVHYDPQTEQGQKVQNSYVKDGATQVDPVALNDQQYNRYLPVKVNGATFPIPDVPELKGRNIASVVVLAPVDFTEATRKTRDTAGTNKNSRQIAAEALKVLIKSPTVENYNDWLDKENKTIPDKQAVVLLVTGSKSSPSSEKEIFMYDIATKTVSKLSGELSSAFVDAAETNSKGSTAVAAAPSNVVETRVPYPDGARIDKEGLLAVEEIDSDLDDSASEYVEAKIPLIDPTQSDNFSEASEQLESFVDISGMPVQPQGDLAVAASNTENNKVSITSGYSKTGSNLLSH